MKKLNRSIEELRAMNRARVARWRKRHRKRIKEYNQKYYRRRRAKSKADAQA
jgi:hypothetical protein